MRVLVVEDDADTADSFGLLLRLWGFDVRVCHDGSEALDIADRYGPQVALLDLGLPGMDGYELARRLRRRAGTARAVLVAVTGYGNAADRRQAKAAGCSFHFTKPVDPEELLDLLHVLERVSP
jgi:CheY-like chemotaxis protein